MRSWVGRVLAIVGLGVFIGFLVAIAAEVVSDPNVIVVGMLAGLFTAIVSLVAGGLIDDDSYRR